MTISLERPAVSDRGQHSLVDPYDEPHTVLALRVVVSRDHLAAALEDAATGHHGALTDPDAWPVDHIRYLVEHRLLAMSALELQQGAEAMAQMAEPDHYDLSVQWYIHGVYRAVDRAYPKTV
ncbi:hypothetical protein [Streptomyces flaveolus]|uniref:hypothetical protein n=1 Tax=Streptomyces flaveolus TaxID=67297 RepID=UPI00340DC95B